MVAPTGPAKAEPAMRSIATPNAHTQSSQPAEVSSIAPVHQHVSSIPPVTASHVKQRQSIVTSHKSPFQSINKRRKHRQKRRRQEDDRKMRPRANVAPLAPKPPSNPSLKQIYHALSPCSSQGAYLNSRRRAQGLCANNAKLTPGKGPGQDPSIIYEPPHRRRGSSTIKADLSISPQVQRRHEARLTSPVSKLGQSGMLQEVSK